MKDTTTTIDEILLTFEKNAVDAWKENISDVAIVRKLRPNREQAKQALLKWHQDKARSYVPEKQEYYVDPTQGLSSYTADYTTMGYNIAIDQTLKAIGGQDNVG